MPSTSTHPGHIVSLLSTLRWEGYAATLHFLYTVQKVSFVMLHKQVNCTSPLNLYDMDQYWTLCVCMVVAQSRSRTLSNATYITSKLNLVDLAGSERLSKTGVSSCITLHCSEWSFYIKLNKLSLNPWLTVLRLFSALIDHSVSLFF